MSPSRGFVLRALRFIPSIHLTEFFAMPTARKSFCFKPGVLLPQTTPAQTTGKYLACRAVVEFILAALLLLAAAPVILAAAALVRLTSRGPAFYSQQRSGLDGRAFTIYKLRTMTHDCERGTGARWAVPGDTRITPLGRWLRATHLDELPQLWNVLRGDMSLIGPRPERPEIVAQLQTVLPAYKTRLRVRPGVTGLAQVQLPADTDLECVRRKLAYDLYYLERRGITLDLRILASTALHVVGVSADRLRRWFRLPDGALIERAAIGRAA